MFRNTALNSNPCPPRKSAISHRNKQGRHKNKLTKYEFFWADDVMKCH